jgi:hypothetical protein
MTLCAGTKQHFSRFGMLLALACAGCGGAGGPKPTLNNSVEGKVTLDGAPLVGVMVQFFPEGNRGLPASNGITDDKGMFKLKCSNDEPGAAVCKHKVVVLKGRTPRRDDPQTPEATDSSAAPSQKRVPQLPEHYGVAAKSPLSIEVTGDKHTYDLTLTARK